MSEFDPDKPFSLSQKARDALKNDTQFPPEARLILEVMNLLGPKSAMTFENCQAICVQVVKACDGDVELAIEGVKSGRFQLEKVR